MRFFSPELYQRFTSDDDRVADQAQLEWEGALKAYRNRLRRLRPDMPRGIRRLADELRLHDALLLHQVSYSGHCLLSLRLDVPENEIVLLDYLTVEPPISNRVELNPEAQSESPMYIFDEIDRLPIVGGKAVFQHSIFFGHGYLFTVRCRDVRISMGEEVLPLPSERTARSAARITSF